MPRLTDLDRALAIGQLQAGVPQNQVAVLFGVSPRAISKLRAQFHITLDVKDRPRSGRPKKMTPQEDHFLTLSALRCRRLFSTDLQSRFAGQYGRRFSAQTIRNRLHTANLQSHRAARSPAMTALHHQARFDESRFCLRQLDHGSKCLSSLEAISMQRDIEMRFCNQWQSHSSTVWDRTLSSKMTTLTPTGRGLSETTSRMWEWRGWNGLPAVLTSIPLNTCGISLGVLFMPE
uniref:Transposase Tc1-like domain-containing protein n=1 Tax=Dicentrarchus labrax TaxID=13489 RepID=A0A8C4GFR7_DICLA